MGNNTLLETQWLCVRSINVADKILSHLINCKSMPLILIACPSVLLLELKLATSEVKKKKRIFRVKAIPDVWKLQWTVEIFVNFFFKIFINLIKKKKKN